MSFQSTDQASSSSRYPRIMLLSLALDKNDTSEKRDRLYSRLRLQAQVQRCTHAADAIRQLASDSPTAIIVTDTAIIEPDNAHVVTAIRAYLTNGGTVILRCFCYHTVDPEKATTFFNQSLELPWILGDKKIMATHLNKEVA